jgi:hypothetical protein
VLKDGPRCANLQKLREKGPDPRVRVEVILRKFGGFTWKVRNKVRLTWKVFRDGPRVGENFWRNGTKRCENQTILGRFSWRSDRFSNRIRFVFRARSMDPRSGPISKDLQEKGKPICIILAESKLLHAAWKEENNDVLHSYAAYSARILEFVVKECSTLTKGWYLIRVFFLDLTRKERWFLGPSLGWSLKMTKAWSWGWPRKFVRPSLGAHGFTFLMIGNRFS